MAQHPKQRRRQKPYLTDNVELGRQFRKHYIRGLRRLLKKGQLKLGGKVEYLKDQTAREMFLEELDASDWNVFIQGPPQGKSDPLEVIKYLAGYMTGGPISDGRLIRFDEEEVWIRARPKHSKRKRRGMSAARPYRLTGLQFMRRWSLHVLPKSFTRSRSYGGYHSSKRKAYLRLCRELLSLKANLDAATPEENSMDQERERKCPRCCEGSLVLVHSETRPSWRVIFEREIYKTNIYSPQHHIGAGRSPPRETDA